MNEPIKNDFVYFRNEILKDMKQIETKINEKVSNLYSYIKKFNTESDEKLNSMNVRLKKLQDNNPALLEEKINAKIEKNKNNFEEKIADIGAKIYILKKDLSDACFKYDKIVLDNLKVTGIIGEGCTYANLKFYIEFINKRIAELSTTKEKIINEIKINKNKINDIVSQFNSDFENQKIVINDMTSIRINEAEKNNLERIYVMEKQMENLRLENYNFSNNLIKKTEELNIQWDKLENIKNEIYEKFDEEKITIKKYIDNLTNTFNSQKKEFNLIKTRFTDLSNILKHFPQMKISSSNEANYDTDLKNNKKELLKLAKRMNFNKKQTLSKEDLELINAEENNIFRLNKEDINNIINEQEIKNKKNNKILLSDNLRKEDSNYINNINLKENLLDISPQKEKGDNINELDISNNNINKNTRKNVVDTNNSNSIENKNIYTKITIKSVNRKSRDNENDNLHDDKNIEKNKNEITIENSRKNEEKINFTKTVNKNIFLNLKKGNKSLQKIKFNNSNEMKERSEKENMYMIKNNIRNKLLKSENAKFHEYLSSSNERKTFNSQLNTTPFNLKLKNFLGKNELKAKEDILTFNLDKYLLNENNEKENKFYKMIIQYIKMTNLNINDKFQNISDKIGNDISTIKKEINQIYNDVNMITWNNNKKIGRMVPFNIKINNYDLYNNSGIQLNMENFKNFYKNNFKKNKSSDKYFSSENQETPKNILDSIEPYLIKKFKDKNI